MERMDSPGADVGQVERYRMVVMRSPDRAVRPGTVMAISSPLHHAALTRLGFTRILKATGFSPVRKRSESLSVRMPCSFSESAPA